jgi:transcriptional regulator with XRE-family HTH domain
MALRKLFADNLVKLRKQRGLSQEALAHEADIDRTYVSSLERGIYSPSLDMVAKLAKVLKVKPEDLLKASSAKGRPER